MITWAALRDGRSNGCIEWVTSIHTLMPGDRILMGAWTCLTVQGPPTGATPDPAPAAPDPT